MLAALKSEFRKLLSVRTTYVIAAIAFALLAFVSFYIEGYRNGAVNTVGEGAHLFLAGSIVQHANVLSIFGAIVGLLLVTHEYRYSTIVYSLTIVNRRSKVLTAKIVAIVSYVFALVLIGDALGFACMLLGLHVTGHALPSQELNLLEYFTKTLLFSEGWALAATLFAVVLRNQVATIAVLFIVPNTVEGLLSLLLKQNTVYLPFTALSQVVSPPTIGGAIGRHLNETGSLSPVQGGLLFFSYLLGAWIIAWVLFVRRDAL